MKYPVKVKRRSDNNVWQIEVIDLPGCVVENGALDIAFDKLNEKIADHLSILTEYGETIPNGSLLEHHIEQNSDSTISWAVIDFDIIPYLGRSHKINVTLPELLIKKIDDRVSKSEHYNTRSGFIAAACLTLLNLNSG